MLNGIARTGRKDGTNMYNIYVSYWNKTQWGQEEKIGKTSTKDPNTILNLLEFNDFGRYEECESENATTKFIIRDSCGNTIDYILTRDLLPWED